MRAKKRLLQLLTVAVVLLSVVSPAHAEDANAGFTADFVADFERRGDSRGQVFLGAERRGENRQ